MIWRAEQLLKFIEIPFVYSLLVIPFSGGSELPYYIDDNGTERLNQLIFPLIFILGIVGSALSIVDPLGRFCKGLLRLSNFSNEIDDWFDKKKDKSQGDYFKPRFLIYIRKNFWNHGINTLPINTEINKIVGMLYFITLVVFLWASLPVESYTMFTESLDTSNFVNGVNTDTKKSVKDGFSVLFFVSIITVSAVAVNSLLAIRKKIRTASIFLYGISHSSNSWIVEEIFQIQEDMNEEEICKEKILRMQEIITEGKVAKEEITQIQEAMREGRWELAEEYTHGYYKTHLLKKFEKDEEVDTDESKAKDAMKFNWPLRKKLKTILILYKNTKGFLSIQKLFLKIVRKDIKLKN